MADTIIRDRSIVIVWEGITMAVNVGTIVITVR